MNKYHQVTHLVSEHMDEELKAFVSDLNQLTTEQLKAMCTYLFQNNDGINGDLLFALYRLTPSNLAQLDIHLFACSYFVNPERQGSRRAFLRASYEEAIALLEGRTEKTFTVLQELEDAMERHGVPEEMRDSIRKTAKEAIESGGGFVAGSSEGEFFGTLDD